MGVIVKGSDAAAAGAGVVQTQGRKGGRRGARKRQSRSGLLSPESSFLADGKGGSLGGDEAGVRGGAAAAGVSALGRRRETTTEDGLTLEGEKSANDVAMIVANNAWEWQDAYDEKVDTWQVREPCARGGTCRI